MRVYLMIIEIYFCQTYVVGEAILMSAHNIGFYEEISNIIP